MSKSKSSGHRFSLLMLLRLRRGFTNNLDLTDEHKVQIYTQLCESVSLRDISYWIEVLFAAGIATLGLVLNSPAVIIGAMLISPLMGPILANGMGLAAGDVVLWLRAAFNLLLSCSLAIVFAAILVVIVPFKEITPEILARTNPTLLDLIVALFSGAVGSVATCKQAKGVAASLPGVAIAVALMPPLCVVGYGIGIYFSLASSQGLTVAKGGGLLFITNLVAIIFTAMIVFFFVHFDVRAVREAIGEWKQENAESQVVSSWLRRLPAYTTFQRVGGLPSRFFLILVTLGIISFPLTKSLEQVRRQVTQQREENQLNSTIKQIWQDNFDGGDDEFRSYIDQVKAKRDNNQVSIQLQVVTDKLYSQEDEDRFVDKLATALDLSPSDITLRFVQIPTSQAVNTESIPVITQVSYLPDLQGELMGEISRSLALVSLPDALQLVDYQVVLRSDNSAFKLVVIYLGDRDLQEDAQVILSNQIRRSLQVNDAMVEYQRLATDQGLIPLTVLDETAAIASAPLNLSNQDQAVLDNVGQILRSHPSLYLRLTIQRPPDSNPASLFSQTEQIRTYLSDNWQIPDSRVQETTNVGEPTQVSFNLFLGDDITDGRNNP
ncbi:sll1151 [Synechocystis sp. PCC 6803]|uniref:Sll1151 protein n=1 Tax=Synechocystis sp. (strain ATCC 27184 / PCC 6803 / Kazusa) TaxID=1111708 RepID=P73791_SYNY3|nr:MULTISPECIES: DUF389 domain-containing protein [unclassified Synechocystis]AGF51531.1 hypothetical protein MYO_112780 [Synechocystis sp. PCC 6803]ALJ67529.1 hypothetical protein AOY38_06545 [Synechocystis sp. PCC 6803]AVP89374.1 DUF389 domain-containing protein [Synechocystis sp. IPPAS B-1465]MBD2618544.1 DUF389 domain-containing protein [Synechocystis sp. FACHB-898]MBD2637862.1 DUF389 domain-containing protein [Synechocystis sp. FACHB-908]